MDPSDTGWLRLREGGLSGSSCVRPLVLVRANCLPSPDVFMSRGLGHCQPSIVTLLCYRTGPDSSSAHILTSILQPASIPHPPPFPTSGGGGGQCSTLEVSFFCIHLWGKPSSCLLLLKTMSTNSTHFAVNKKVAFLKMWVPFLPYVNIV